MTKISTRFGTDGTCSASTCRSGSEIVMIAPSKKEPPITSHSFLDRVSPAPIRSPIGVIASSAPSVKNIIPASSSTAPIKNSVKSPVGSGAIVKHSSSTITRIGATAFSASSSFSSKFVR